MTVSQKHLLVLPLSLSLLQQGAAGRQQSGLSPIGVLWLPAGNSWSPLLLLVDQDPAGSPGRGEGLIGSNKQAAFTHRQVLLMKRPH